MSTELEVKTENQVAKNIVKENLELPTFSPSTDAYETEESFTITVEMPGVEEKSVDIRVEGEELRLNAKVEKIEEKESHHLLHSEYYTGHYKRVFTLPKEADTNKISASFKHGLLRLTIPKIEKAKPKKILVQSA